MIASWRRWPLPILAAVACTLGTSAFGHTTGLSTSDLKFGTNGLNAVVGLAGADLTLILAKLEEGSSIDGDNDGALTREEFVNGLDRFRKFGANCLQVEFDGQRVPGSSLKLAFDDQDNFRMELNFTGERPARLRIRAALFEHLPPEHIHFVAVHDANDVSLGNKMLRPADAWLELEVPRAGTTKAEPHISTFVGFLKLGVEHIGTGYDHLLFLLALLLVCPNFKSAIEVVTFFTLAHSFTLAFATLNLVWVSSRVVEPAIAASIVYVGVENFVRPEGPKGRWLITFLFGLIHGFGFATVLRDLGVATSTTGVTMPLVAFNLGVELGQIVIAGIMLPAIWKLRKWELFRRRGMPACSAIVASVGGYWLIERLFFS